jgi:hypothetical protein
MISYEMHWLRILISISNNPTILRKGLMMKSTSWLSLLIIPVLAFTGCVPVGATMQPTQRRQLPSLALLPATATMIPAVTLTPVITGTGPSATLSPPIDTKLSATLSPTLPPTPVDTLEPEIARATLEPLLRDPLNCDVPCFWGIIPGKTDFNEARTLFSRLGFTPFEGTDLYSGRDFYTIGYESSIGRDSSVTLFPSHHRIANIFITPEIIKQKVGSPREWIAYSPETLIRKYGKPSRVDFYLAWPGGGGSEIIMKMYFDASDLIVQYTGENMLPSSNHSPRLCPLTAPFDYVRLWLGTEPPNRPLAGVPLEQATSLAVDQFTQLMLGDPKQACFTLNGDAFQ